MKPAVQSKPAIVLPFNDPGGLMLAHLDRITPQLKAIFGRAFVSITAETRHAQPAPVDAVARDNFFHVTYPPAGARVGEHFLALFTAAANALADDHLLHLCFIDRLAFALQSEHRAQFITDVLAVTEPDAPRLFQRSPAAWATHPQNYHEIEHMATRVGELLFGRSLDYAWCHLAITAGQLREALPHIKRSDMSMLAEIVLVHRAKIHTQDVDWLAWEDPFITGCEAGQLKAEREADIAETQKRLSYVLPTLQLLAQAASVGSPSSERNAYVAE